MKAILLSYRNPPYEPGFWRGPNHGNSTLNIFTLYCKVYSSLMFIISFIVNILWLLLPFSLTVIIIIIIRGVCSTVVACWAAGQQVERLDLHQGHDS